MTPRLSPALVLLGLLAIPRVALSEDDPVLWPGRQRQFLQDGPGLLLSDGDRDRLLAMSNGERERFIDDFLAQDPQPDTPENELLAAIDRRRELVEAEFLSYLDHRAHVLFLNGEPLERKVIECGQTFQPIEVWSYGEEGATPWLLFYKAGPGRPYRVWLPIDSKRALYNRDMEYWLEQWEELRGRLSGKRIDLRACPEALFVDQVTGVSGLTGFTDKRPTTKAFLKFLEAPADIGQWALRAVAHGAQPGVSPLEVESVQVLYPERLRQRIVTRFQITIPADAALEAYTEEDKNEFRLGLEGLVEQEGRVFEEFRMRFQLEPPKEDSAIALVFERALRPGRSFLVRFRLRDEVGGRSILVSRGLRVPGEPEKLAELPVPEDTIIALAEELDMTRIEGRDSLLLVPPDADLILGLWRAAVLVTGDRIEKVVFLVDGEQQLTRTTPPYSAELRLAQFPKEQLVRVEGYDAAGELVASDEAFLNQPRGSFRVRILEPQRGAAVSGRVLARAEVTVPDERRIETVDFLVNDERVARLEGGPWETEIEVPTGDEVSYLTVLATLDDGGSVEEVRFLNAPQYLEELEVSLVELLTTVTDRSLRPVSDLVRDDFGVLEDGRPQEITKFERMDNLPLSIGITIDTSGSMAMSLPEAKKAAVEFLESVITPRDRAFALAFAGQPTLLIPPTDDVGAIEGALEDLQSLGWTSLHDAVVASLYYFRAVKGQRALILLSDGDDSSSHYPFRDALEYARRSGVAIYSVGLNVGKMQTGIRRKLNQLAEETGGRSFFIQRAEELRGVYREIEDELRSQYFIAYASDNTDGAEEQFRTVEVKVRGGFKARTIAGYYP